MVKTYPFEGKLYVESGDVRPPKKGEVFLKWGGDVAKAGIDAGERCPILIPAPSPRVLTGYDPDAKAGDVYQYGGERWRLVEHRLPVNGEMWIVFSSADTDVWGCVTDTPPTESWSPSKNRWIVEPYAEASPAPAVAEGTADIATQIREQCAALERLLLTKNRNYGNSVSEVPRFNKKLTPIDALFVRFSDKLKRLEYLLANPDADDGGESLDDTMRDISGYGVLYPILKGLPPCTT